MEIEITRTIPQREFMESDKKFRDSKQFTQYADTDIRIYVTILSSGTVKKRYGIVFKAKFKTQSHKYYGENAEVCRARTKAWCQSPKGTLAVCEYEQSLKCKARRKIYSQSPEGKVSQAKRGAKYARTLKGKANNAKKSAMRERNYGYAPMNKPFDGAHFHHTHLGGDHSSGIYIPAELHTSVWHSINDVDTMNEINALAFEWLYVNEVI